MPALGERREGRKRERRGETTPHGISFGCFIFIEMIIVSWWNFFFFFAMALVIGTRSRVQRSLNFSGKQFSLRRIIDEKRGRTRRGNKSTARKRSTINFNFNSHILVDFSFIVLRIHKQFNECLLSS